MKRIVGLLILVLLMQCAIAESAPADGLYTIGVSSSAKMFRVLNCVLRVEDEKMTAVLTMSGSGYGYLYQGTSAQADAAPVESWTPYFEDGEGRHCFAIEIPALDADVDMAAWSIRYEKWYDRILQFFSNTLSPYQEIAADGVYSANICSDTALDGMPCLLYSKDGEMRIEADGLEMELPSLDLRLPVDGGWMKIESLGIEPYAVLAADGEYSAEAQTDSNLLRFTDCRLSISGGVMTAQLTAKNKSFDYLYLGSASEAAGDPDGWIPAETNEDGAYCYSFVIPSLDNSMQLATYSAKKKMWYDRKLCIDSQSLLAQ